MESRLAPLILTATGATALGKATRLQELWSGYGALFRVALVGGAAPSVIVKHIRPPQRGRHPAGWNTDHGHRRKCRSYRVESAWYRHYAPRCPEACRVPRCLAAREQDGEMLLVLEDLDVSGYPVRKRRVFAEDTLLGLDWLAAFHARFLGSAPDGLWKTGSYWHLATRPEELAAMGDGPLFRAAALIDRRLQEARFRTIIHGDAKLENFCFSPDGRRVAAVDFQYSGGGCGMLDVAYFLASCLPERECERLEDRLLARYFSRLREALTAAGSAADGAALEAEWRALYPVAWADYCRFLAGWGPQWIERGGYGERLALQVATRLLAGEP